MFGKLFKNSKNARFLFLELLMIFIGVYLAFLFQNYSEQRKIDKEKEKVLMSLKLELEIFRTSFPDFANFQNEKNQEWDSLFRVRETADFYTWRYLEPQYNFQVIEYALDQKGTDIVSFEIYEELSALYSNIKRLEHAERLMTEHGQKYRNILNGWDENSWAAKERKADNRLNFFKFRVAGYDRSFILERIAKDSERLLVEINQELGDKNTRIAEINLLHKYLEQGTDPERIQRVFSNYFKQYSPEEFENLVKEWQTENLPDQSLE